ncbi:hypothetical protein ACFE04_019159 [Oxalis oulophora]
MEESSSSQWWKAPVFFTISVVLAFLAITTAIYPTNNTNNTTNPLLKPLANHLFIKASVALRRSGFHTVATYLQISPEIFLSSPNTTIFAIKDSALLNSSLPPWLLKDLLQYHTVPISVSMNDMLKKHEGHCFQTMFQGKSVAVTKLVAEERLVEINHVFVSQPDLFLDHGLVIHGVVGMFSVLDPQDVKQGWGYIQAPVCDSNSSLVSDIRLGKNVIEWMRIIRSLSSNGFVSYAIGLHSILDSILTDNMNLSSVTIFTPPEFAFLASPSGFLRKMVRLHILPQRFNYSELAGLSGKGPVVTLVRDQVLEITGVGNSTTQALAVNGVEIVAPEIFSSENFMVHGIARPFEMTEHQTRAR